MYAWKWWRENRARAFLYMILVVSLPVLFALSARSRVVFGGAATREAVALGVWQVTLAGLIGFGSLVVAFTGLGLGASGVGEESAQGTLDFLLTRPRRRKYFVWSGWATGAAALLITVLLAVLGTFGTLVSVTGFVSNWKLLAMVVPLFVPGAVVYGLTYFITALTKSARNGLSLSLGLIVLELLLAWAVNFQWRVDLPTPIDVLAARRWATTPGTQFPVAATIGWSLVALAFPLATQFLFERVEV